MAAETLEQIALRVAFGTFTSNAGIGSEEVDPATAMETSEEDWHNNVAHWEPFEHWSMAEVREQIESLQQAILLELKQVVSTMAGTARG